MQFNNDPKLFISQIDVTFRSVCYRVELELQFLARFDKITDISMFALTTRTKQIKLPMSPTVMKAALSLAHLFAL